MHTSRLKSLALRLLPVLSIFLVAPSLWAVSTTIVISQVYGGGGSAAAQYNADYVELFNLSAIPQSLNGLAVQYISSAGTLAASGGIFVLPNITLAPGQRFLLASNTACTPLTTPTCINTPTPDLTTGLSASGSAGRIYLTNGTAALTVTAGTCAVSEPVIDAVAYGSGALCGEGTPAPATTTTLIAVRTNACVDTDSNSADFTAVLVTAGTNPPRNSTSAATPCNTASIGVSGTATPASVYQGNSTLLTVMLSTATNPTSTGLTATANLSAFGGSATQPLYDDGTHGDVTAGDRIYSYSLAVPTSSTVGSNTINVSAMDAQLRTTTGTIALTVLAPIALLPIHTVQGSTPGTSPYVGQMVMVSGIVTGIRTNGFYLQARDVDADANAATPEGIFIHTTTGAVPATAVVGTNLQVTGLVALYPTLSVIPGVELDNPSAYTVLASAQPLPTPITLTTTNPSPTGGFGQLQRYQSMRVLVPSLTTTGPTDGTQPSEANEVYVSNGLFFGTVTGNARAVREPGLEVLDPLTASQAATIPRFDDNPEVFQVDSVGMVGGTAGPIDVTSNTLLTNVSGVLDFNNPSDSTAPPKSTPVLVIDATNRPTVSGGMVLKTVRAAQPGETTIGDQNMERFYNVTGETSGAVKLTASGYALRLAKASLVVRNVYNSPDIFCLEEIENIQTLNDLIARISADAVAAGQTDPQYTGYLVNGNDSSGINVAFMVKQSKITVIDVSQFGKTTTTTGTATILNDRPPLVLHAGIKRVAQADYLITVIVNHLRSLNGVTDNTSTGANVRTKREQQAEFLAKLIQGYQAAGEHVISVGDYNTFEFNDGLVDSFGIISGNAAPATQDVLPGTTGLVTPVLVDAAPTNLATATYSYVFQGNAQSIDHVQVTQDIAGIVTTDAAHFDADFPVIDRNDPTTPLVSSDHDGLVAYLKVPGTTVISVTPTTLTFASQPLKSTTSQTVTVKNTGVGPITIASIAASANFSQTNTCGTSLAAGASCVVTVSFTPIVTGPITGTLTLTDNDITGTQTVTLSGTAAGLFSTIALTPTLTSVVAGATYTLTATVTSNVGNAPTGTVTFLDGTTSLGSKAVAGGVATLTTTTLSVGTHSITAVYNGDANYPVSAASAPATVIVTAAPVPDFTFFVSNTALIVTQSQPSSSTILNVAMTNGFSSAVTFACAGLPANSRCTFSPASLSASGSTTLTVTINSASAALPLPGNAFGGVLVAGLLALPFCLRKRVRSALRIAAVLLVLAGVASVVSGCSNSVATPAGSSSMVTVTATGGGITRSSTFTLMVQ